jgi:hypothetical protein
MSHPNAALLPPVAKEKSFSEKSYDSQLPTTMNYTQMGLDS